jgi:hypothetical protein
MIMDEELSHGRLKRALVTILAIVFSVYALGVLGRQVIGRVEFYAAILGTTSATLAALCWWYVLRGPAAIKNLGFHYALLWGKIVGGVCLLAGYVGPIILTPNANSGPLFGIFISGPIGFLVGVVSGFVYGLLRSRAPDQAL